MSKSPAVKVVRAASDPDAPTMLRSWLGNNDRLRGFAKDNRGAGSYPASWHRAYPAVTLALQTRISALTYRIPQVPMASIGHEKRCPRCSFGVHHVEGYRASRFGSGERSPGPTRPVPNGAPPRRHLGPSRRCRRMQTTTPRTSARGLLGWTQLRAYGDYPPAEEMLVTVAQRIRRRVVVRPPTE